MINLLLKTLFVKILLSFTDKYPSAWYLSINNIYIYFYDQFIIQFSWQNNYPLCYLDYFDQQKVLSLATSKLSALVFKLVKSVFDARIDVSMPFSPGKLCSLHNYIDLIQLLHSQQKVTTAQETLNSSQHCILLVYWMIMAFHLAYNLLSVLLITISILNSVWLEFRNPFL